MEDNGSLPVINKRVSSAEGMYICRWGNWEKCIDEEQRKVPGVGVCNRFAHLAKKIL